MAAGMLRSRCLRPGSCSISLIQSKVRYAASGAYYVLLPEVPPDTPETNAIMRLQELPNFKEITPGQVVTGCAKLAIEYDVQLGKHIDALKDVKQPKTFKSVFEPIERMSQPLNFAWRTAKNLRNVCNDEGYRNAFQRIHPQVERATNERWASHALYNSVKEVRADSGNLDEFQLQLTDLYLLEARHNGIELLGDDKQAFLQTLHRLVEQTNHFRNRVMLSHSLFSHTIDDFSMIADMPRSLITAMAADKTNPSRGPWKLTLNQNIYRPFLEFCPHRMTRWNAWRADNNRCTVEDDSLNLSNHNIIGDIRQYRMSIAKMLGYSSFAAMSMETKMAGSVDNVTAFIDRLKDRFHSEALQEVAALQDFARSEGFNDKLQMWDIPYWRRRQNEHLYSVNLQDVSEYFPLPHVLDGLFKLCHSLFSISITEHTGDVDVWHPDVRFFKVFDSTDGRLLAVFYLDAYARPTQKMSGAWMEYGRERSTLCDVLPISYLNLNLNPPLASQPSLLSINELDSLFSVFGSGLQQMLTRVPYSEMAGQRNVQWDSVNTCSHVMSMLLQQPIMLQNLSKHWSTGQQVPRSTIDILTARRQHMQAYDMMRQLYFSAFDLDVHSEVRTYWVQAMQRVWQQFVPMPLDKDDNHPCSLTQIFASQHAAAYYSFKYSEMIAADIVKTFVDAGLDKPKQMAVIGKRFRDTYLSLGGGVPAKEVFRRFQGRDPSIEPLIERYSNK